MNISNAERKEQETGLNAMESGSGEYGCIDFKDGKNRYTGWNLDLTGSYGKEGVTRSRDFHFHFRKGGASQFD